MLSLPCSCELFLLSFLYIIYLFTLYKPASFFFFKLSLLLVLAGLDLNLNRNTNST